MLQVNLFGLDSTCDCFEQVIDPYSSFGGLRYPRINTIVVDISTFCRLNYVVVSRKSDCVMLSAIIHPCREQKLTIFFYFQPLAKPFVFN
jgi:hypothetical protein